MVERGWPSVVRDPWVNTRDTMRLPSGRTFHRITEACAIWTLSLDSQVRREVGLIPG